MFGNIKKILFGVALIGRIMSGNCLASSMIEHDSSNQSSRRSSGQQETVTVRPYEKAALKVFEEYKDSFNRDNLDENFINLMKQIAGGTYDGCAGFSDNINFTKTLTTLLLKSIKLDASSAVKMKAYFCCQALNVSSSHAANLIKEYQLSENFREQCQDIYNEYVKFIKKDWLLTVQLNSIIDELEAKVKE